MSGCGRVAGNAANPVPALPLARFRSGCSFGSGGTPPACPRQRHKGNAMVQPHAERRDDSVDRVVTDRC